MHKIFRKSQDSNVRLEVALSCRSDKIALAVLMAQIVHILVRLHIGFVSSIFVAPK